MITTQISNPFYEISLDDEKQRLYIKMIGFWSTGYRVEHFLDDLTIVMRKLDSEFTTICDLNEFIPPLRQGSDIIINCYKILKQKGSKRLAAIVPSREAVNIALHRYCSKADTKYKIFSLKNDAEEWLEKEQIANIL